MTQTIEGESIEEKRSTLLMVVEGQEKYWRYVYNSWERCLQIVRRREVSYSLVFSVFVLHFQTILLLISAF